MLDTSVLCVINLKTDRLMGAEMAEFSQKRFVDVGQQIFQDLVEGYHNTLHNPQGYPYGEVEDHRALYEVFAGMSFAAAEEFAKVFRHQEKN